MHCTTTYKFLVLDLKILLISTDIKTMASQEIEKLKNLDILIVNALRIEPHISHILIYKRRLIL